MIPTPENGRETETHDQPSSTTTSALTHEWQQGEQVEKRQLSDNSNDGQPGALREVVAASPEDGEDRAPRREVLLVYPHS